MEDNQTEFFTCACNLQEHIILMTLDKVNKEDYESGFRNSIIISCQLPKVPFLSRIKYAFGYLIGRNPISHWSETVIEEKQAKKMVEMLSQVIE